MKTFNLTDLFDSTNFIENIQINQAKRLTYETENDKFLIDNFKEIKSFFIRIDTKTGVKLTCDQAYSFEQSALGGYLGIPFDASQDWLWISNLPTERQINSDNQILSEQIASLIGIAWIENESSIQFQCIDGYQLDLVIWRFPSTFSLEHLTAFAPFETQCYFLWGSHSTIKRPADLYRHLIHGSVYDLRYSWPHHKKCFSENEAHALYTVYAGLEKTTGKSLYRYFQLQIVLSVIHRQAEDGAWYHGMWTDSSECHYRLHTSGVHLLLDEYARSGCSTVQSALDKAVAFLSKTADRLDCGVWFLHDSLELSEEAINKGPFKWIPNRTLGKSVSNMLVLNTHLDTTIALNRYAQLTGDRQYDDLIASSLNSTRTVLSLKPADWLYKPLFWAIGLTMLPTQIATRLPLPLRAIKRIAAEYLIKKLPDIKDKFPRLVMPNGYIDRELSLRTWAIDYQTINLMDLARYARAFPGQFDDSILDKALAFTHDNGLIERYRELQPGKRYAPGFWMEALYHRCLAKQDIKYRHWLAEALLQCYDSGLGIAPSLLGSNGEAVSYADQVASPLSINPEIITANLSRKDSLELLLVNTSNNTIEFPSLAKPFDRLYWYGTDEKPVDSDLIRITGRSWLIGRTR